MMTVPTRMMCKPPRYNTMSALLCVHAVSVLLKKNQKKIMMREYFLEIRYGRFTHRILLSLYLSYIYYITMMSESRRFPKVQISLLYVCGLSLYRVLCVYTILTGHANLTNECRGVLLVSLYMCPLRTKVQMTVALDCQIGRVRPAQVMSALD